MEPELAVLLHLRLLAFELRLYCAGSIEIVWMKSIEIAYVPQPADFQTKSVDGFWCLVMSRALHIG